MDVSVIIVNYNTVDLTINCLKSVYEKTEDVHFEVIVIDNASIDDSTNRIKSEFPNVRLIESSENLGFGKANNLGIKIAKGKYLFLLNSDTLLLNNAVKLFFDWMEENNIYDTIGAIGSYLLDSSFNTIHSYGEFPSFKKTMRDEFHFMFKKDQTNNINHKVEKKVEYITGADLFIQKTTLDKIGLFDEDFFMYYEDSELQNRMKQYNYTIKIITEPRIIHLEGRSSKVSNVRRMFFCQSQMIYFRKQYSLINFILYKTIFTIIRLLKLTNKNYSIKENLTHFIRIIRS